MTSPGLPSISPTLSRTHSQPPPRTKSSSALSSTSSRPKRNKSSSSLVSHGHGHGHHAIQFTHHGKKSTRKGSSGGRRPGVEFGFTSLVPAVESSAVDDEEEEEDREGGEEEERGGRSMVQRRGSGSGAGSSKSRERGDRERDRLRSRERNEARIALADEARRVAGEVESEERRKEGEGRRAAMLRVLSPPAVVGSVGEGSDWESATDSPRPVTKALPGTSLRVESGLGKAMGGELDANQLKVAPQDVEREVSPSRPTGRATFQLVDDDELSSTPPDTPTHLAPSQRDRIARRPPPYAQLPLRQATPPPTPPQQHVTPPPPVAAPSAPLQSTIAFPTSSDPPSPQAPAKYRPRQARKSSNASLASIASTRSLAASFHGLMGPPSPAFRRTASSLAPTVDRGTVATGHVFESTGMGHRRNGSMSSLRSLRSVVEAAEAGPSGMGERRTSTMGANEGRQAVRRLKLANLSAGSDAGGAGTVGGGAAAALASLGGTRPAPAKRSASGYFATLRGLANIPGLTPPSPAPSPPPTRLSMPPPHFYQSYSYAQTSRLTPHVPTRHLKIHRADP